MRMRKCVKQIKTELIYLGMGKQITKFILVAIIAISLNTNLQAQQKELVKWYTIEEVQNLVKSKPRKIFIDMYTDWCGWCKVMDKKTFTDEGIANKLNNDYYAVKFDAEGKESVTFKDQTFNFVAQGSRGYHELAAALMQGQMSYPTSVFLDENLNLLTPVPGYQTPDKLDPILDFFGKDHYKTINWEQYLSQRADAKN